DEALTQLLRGTGLTFRHSGDNGISIVPANPGKPTAPATGKGSGSPAGDATDQGDAQGAGKTGTPSRAHPRRASIQPGGAARVEAGQGAGDSDLQSAVARD